MFSGIIENQAKIVDIQEGRFIIENIFSEDKEWIHIWQSIAHDGACMSITTCDTDTYSFFSMEESLKKTNFSHKKVGDYFNVERCVQYGERIDWHFVSGHIDYSGTVSDIQHSSDWSMEVRIFYPERFWSNIISKWSIAINGVSLTVVDDAKWEFSVRLIPLTQKLTNLGNLQVNDTVNIEFDMLGKYILKNAQTDSSYERDTTDLIS